MPDTPPPGATPTGYQRTSGGGVRWHPPSPEELGRLLPGYEIESLLDASLTHLTNLRSLKTLEIKSCPQLTPAAIAAFQKARPDVTVTR